MKTNIVAIVQARMSASRLPGKMMLLLHGAPIIEWVFRRTKKARLIQNIIFAIPDNRDNDVLKAHLEKIGAAVYRGSEDDVLSRVYYAAKEYNATHIVRICADNPFVAGPEIDRLIKIFLETDCDYAYNHIPKNNCYPDGIGAEIASFRVLEDIYNRARSSDHRAHMFNYIWANSEQFKILTFDPTDKRLAYPNIKLDIDTMQNYEKLCSMKVNIEMEAHEIVAAAKAIE